MEKETKNYEIGFLLKNGKDYPEISSVLARHNIGVVGPEKQPTRIRLAYPIKKESSAFFGNFYFSANPNQIKEIGEELKLNKNLLRFIIVSQPAGEVPPRPSVRQIRRRAVPPAPLKTMEPASAQPIKKVEPAPVLSNEELERRLEEILK
jgi:ribosomal protein S6